MCTRQLFWSGCRDLNAGPPCTPRQAQVEVVLVIADCLDALRKTHGIRVNPTHPYHVPMHCLVLGHSGTAGFGLDSVAETWPALFERYLNHSNDTVWTVSAVPLFPVGNRAIDYALARVAEGLPDLVVLSLNAYPCVVPVVSANVRHRFGKRAERVYSRLERRLEKRADASHGPPAKTNQLAQRWARRVFGTRTMASVDEVGRVYAEILRGLARLEGVQVAVLAEAMFGESVRQRAPNLVGQVTELQRLVRPTAEDHRFLWCDATGWLSPDGGVPYWHVDDVHLSARGNARYAEMLAASLAPSLHWQKLEG